MPRMRKPWYQQLFNIIAWIITGMLFVAALPFLSDNPPGRINTTTVAIFTGVCILIFILLNVLFKYRRIKWITNDNLVIYIVKFSKKLIWTFLGGLSVLWITVIVNHPKISHQQFAAIYNKPVFDQSDKRFNILILPWEQECTYQGRTYNIGRVIQKRIDELGIKENMVFFKSWLIAFKTASLKL